MRASLFILGLLLMVGGGVAFYYSASRMGQLVTLWGSVERIISSDAASEYEMYKTIQVVGPGIAVLGLILFVAGLVLSESRTVPQYQYPPQYYPPPAPQAPQSSQRQPVCPYCSTPLVFVAQYGRWFCPGCQRYL
jgi:hypothetical protein